MFAPQSIGGTASGGLEAHQHRQALPVREGGHRGRVRAGRCGVEREFNTATVHQGYIEPHNATALWNADGKITIWMSTQGSFTARQQTAELLQIPISQREGHSDGNRRRLRRQDLGLSAAGRRDCSRKKSGRPVKMVMNRTDVFEATGPTPGSHMRVKLGATKDGKLVAGEAWIAFEAGAYPGSPDRPGLHVRLRLLRPSATAASKASTSASTSRGRNAYRAPGSTHVAFATETVIDEICRKACRSTRSTSA